MSYMLSKQRYLSDGDGHGHRHLMFFAPLVFGRMLDMIDGNCA